MPGCALCETDGGAVVWRAGPMRLVRVSQPGIGAFFRLVWAAHVAEFSDLSPSDRRLVTDALASVEQVLRRHLAPAKVNLASLGNQVPHLHWHVIARWPWDAHWPDPVWAPPRREAAPAELERVAASLAAVEQDLRARLQRLRPPPFLFTTA